MEDICRFNDYPGLQEQFENMYAARRDGFFEELRRGDMQYSLLLKKRANMSMVLRSKIKDAVPEFEEYMDTVYAQELYEFDKVYEQGFCDALEALKVLGFPACMR